VFQPVEFLAGERWLICHWQRCKVYRIGSAEPIEADAQLCDSIEKSVAKRWLDQGGETAGDIGVLFLYELALEYSRARRALWNWGDSWEQEFYAQPAEGHPAKLVKPLTDLHRLHGELHRRLAGLNVPRDCAVSGWFDQVRQRDTARRVDEMVDRSLANLRGFGDSLRQAVSLTQSYATLRHISLAEEQKERSEQLQHRFEHKGLVPVADREALGLPVRQESRVGPAVVAHRQCPVPQVDDLHRMRMATRHTCPVRVVASVHRFGSAGCHLSHVRLNWFLLHGCHCRCQLLWAGRCGPRQVLTLALMPRLCWSDRMVASCPTATSSSELARYDLTENASSETAMVFGELYPYGTEWKFRAVGQGYVSGLAGIARDYGVSVA